MHSIMCRRAPIHWLRPRAPLDQPVSPSVPPTVNLPDYFEANPGYRFIIEILCDLTFYVLHPGLPLLYCMFPADVDCLVHTLLCPRGA